MGRLSQAAGIAPLYGSGFTPAGQPYLLMPFYQHGSLQDQVDRGGALPAERVRTIGVRIARAVQTAHENGVLHRDLKPANILMRRDGHPDVADFGIAHLTDDALGTSQALTMTPLYTAPEVFDGVESGAASDVYSIGATLFALLNGRAAYANTDGTAPVMTLLRRIHEEPVPVLPATVPAGLAAVIARSMAKNPADRQVSAGQLADELAAASAGVATAPAGRAGSGTRRMPAIALAIAALLLIVGGVVAAATLLNGDDDPGTAQEPTAVPQPTAQVAAATATVPADPTPEPEPTTSIAVAAADFDVAAARQAATTALVRIEAFSCTSAELATGVILSDGSIVTESGVLRSPWHVDIVKGGQVVPARPARLDPELGLGFVTVDESGLFDPLPEAVVSPGDTVAFVGIDRRPALATVIEPPAGRLLQRAEIDPSASGNPVETGDLVVDGAGRMVGISRVSAGTIEIIPPSRFTAASDLAPPNFSCQSLDGDLLAGDAESAVSPAVGELLTMQQLSNAYANERWDLVKVLEPEKTTYTTASFVNGWRPLRQGFIYPVDRRIADGQAIWRIGLIGHETWNGSDLTTLFCVTWAVDPVSGTVVQTNQDNVIVFGSQPGQPQQPGFVDPAELRPTIENTCPL